MQHCMQSGKIVLRHRSQDAQRLSGSCTYRNGLGTDDVNPADCSTLAKPDHYCIACLVN